MKVYDYKKTNPFVWCLAFCMSFFSLNLTAQDSGDMACTNQVNISIGTDCELDLAVGLFTEGNLNDDGFTVTFSGGGPGGSQVSGVIGQDMVDIECGMYTFTVSNGSNPPNTCWGTVKIEDKLPPTPPEHPCTPEDADAEEEDGVDGGSDEECTATCFDVDQRFFNAISDLGPGVYYDNVVNPNTNDVSAGSGWTDCTDEIVFLGDNKGYPLYYFIKETILPEDCDDPTRINYILNFKDGKGNAGADTFSFNVLPIAPGEMPLVPITYEGECTDDADDLCPTKDGVVNTGVPTIENENDLDNDVEISLIEFTKETQGGLNGGSAIVCNLMLSYWDIKTIPGCERTEIRTVGGNSVDLCGNSRKILREWTVIDWCDNRILQLFNEDEEPTNIQILHLKDTEEPEVEDDELSESTDPWKCSAEFEITIDADDNCADEDALLYTLTGPAGVSITGGGVGNPTFEIKHLPAGEWEFTAYVEDCCGNIGTATIDVSVEDEIKPFAIAKEFTVASVIEIPDSEDDDKNVEAIAKVYWQSIDNGSWDACSDLQYYVRREDGDPNNCDDKDCYPSDEMIAARASRDGVSLAEAERREVEDFQDVVECLTEEGNRIKFAERGGNPASGSSPNPPCNMCFNDGAREIRNAEIEFNGDEWGDFVKFCCEDLDSNASDTDVDGDGFKNEHRVELFVIDRQGNWSITWGWVKVEDPNPPVLHIEDYDAFCHDEVLNGPLDEALERIAADAISSVSAKGVCGQEYEVSQDNLDNIWYDPSCKYGSFTIDYSVRGNKGSVVRGTQRVRILYKDDFACSSVDQFASGALDDDLDAICTPDPSPDLTWDAGPCELIGWSMESDTFQFETDACVKVLNKWTVIDWCVYDADRKGEVWQNRLFDHWDDFESYWETFDAGRNAASIYAINDYGDFDVVRHNNPHWYLFFDSEDGYNNCTERFENNFDTYNSSGYIGPYWIDSDAFNGVRESSTRGSTWIPDEDVPHWETGVYCWEQVIKVSEDDAPVITRFDGDMIVDSILVDCNEDINLTLTAADTGDCPADWLKWELFIVTKNSAGEETSVVSVGRKNGLSVDYNLGDVFVGSNGMDMVCLRAKAWDGCGNVDIYDFVYKIIDAKPPTPYCINLSTALMLDPDGDGPLVSMVELWACDFDLGSFDNCEGGLFFTFDGVPMGTADSPWSNGFDPFYIYEHYYTASGVLFFDVSGLGNGDNWRNPTTAAAMDAGVVADVIEAYMTGQPYEGEEVYRWLPNGHIDEACTNPASRGTAGKVFIEEDIVAGGDTDVQMDVWDNKLNTDWCDVDVTLRCGDCGDGGSLASVAGTISTEAGNDVADVQVTLDNLSNPEWTLTDVTGIDGQYAFAANPMYNGYDISGVKGGAHDEGVSTLDLVMIQRHILGLAPFTSPYKVIASDVNNNGDLSAADLIVLRKLILGLYKEFPENVSWRFIDGAQNLTVENALESKSEVINIATLEADMTNENFVAVKIGDVNGDAKTNARDNRTQVRNANRLALTIEDQNVKAGEVVNVTFGTNEFSQVYGYQFTVELNGVQFEAVKAGAANMTNDNVALLDDNTMTVSYADVNGLNATDNLFTLAVVATRDGSIGDMIAITSSTLNSEAYSGTSLDVSTVELTLEGQATAEFELGQNEPNPFNDFTVVGFTLPQAGQAQLTVYDVAGKVVTSKFGEYAKGYNTEKFTKAELGVSGVLYYTLESGEFTATKKMIIIE